MTFDDRLCSTDSSSSALEFLFGSTLVLIEDRPVSPFLHGTYLTLIGLLVVSSDVSSEHGGADRLRLEVEEDDDVAGILNNNSDKPH